MADYCRMRDGDHNRMHGHIQVFVEVCGLDLEFSVNTVGKLWKIAT